MVNSPVFHAAIMTLWLVAFPGFLNISHAPGIVNVMSVVMTAAPSLFILRSVQAILRISGLSEVHIEKCEITVLVSILEGIDNRASGIRGYCPHWLKYQDFLRMNSIFNVLYYIVLNCTVLYCITETSLDVLKVRLWFIVGDLNFPIEQWFCLC